MKKRIGRLIVITDTHIQSRFTHEELAGLACAGGADVIQLRDKKMSDDEFTQVALRVRDICRQHEKLLIINDRVEVARVVEADGVHIGRGDMPVGEARALFGDNAIIGTSAGSVNEAREAESAGADYIGFGHIFATSSKEKPALPVGLERLAAACQSVKFPVIAIGGITDAGVADVMQAGAWGFAVIGAVCGARDPRAATAGLRAALDRQLSQ